MNSHLFSPAFSRLRTGQILGQPKSGEFPNGKHSNGDPATSAALKGEIFDLSRHTMPDSLPWQLILIIHGRLRRRCADLEQFRSDAIPVESYVDCYLLNTSQTPAKGIHS
jgi:hypothetical protein